MKQPAVQLEPIKMTRTSIYHVYCFQHVPFYNHSASIMHHGIIIYAASIAHLVSLPVCILLLYQLLMHNWCANHHCSLTLHNHTSPLSHHRGCWPQSWLSIYLFTYLFIYLFISWFIYLFIYLSVFITPCPRVLSPCVYLSVCPCLVDLWPTWSNFS